MIFSRGLLLFAVLFTLAWPGSGHASAGNRATSVTGTWYSATGSITFKANGTINYRGKSYYYAVTNGGLIQLKGRHGEKSIPYQLSGGKLILTEDGKVNVYRRNR